MIFYTDMYKNKTAIKIRTNSNLNEFIEHSTRFGFLKLLLSCCKVVFPYQLEMI